MSFFYKVEITVLCCIVSRVAVSTANFTKANDSTSLWPNSFDFSFSSPTEANTCRSTDMCGTMKGFCEHGTCHTRPCSNDIYCICDAEYTGMYCRSRIPKSGASQTTSRTNGKTHVSGNNISGKMQAPPSRNGARSSVNENVGQKGVDTGSVKSSTGPQVTVVTDTVTTTTDSSTVASTTTTTVTTAKAPVSAAVKEMTTSKNGVITPHETNTAAVAESTTADFGNTTETVGEKINKKLKNGEIKVENILDVLIASVKENEAHAHNVSIQPMTTTPASKETVSNMAATTERTAQPPAGTTPITAATTSRSTIHPDGSYIKGPESTYISDNGPINLDTANQTVKETANNQSVKNTSDTVTIPFTILKLSGITPGPKPTDVTAISANTNMTFKESNEAKLVKIVESIIIHKPKGSVISNTKGSVNIGNTFVDKGVQRAGDGSKQETSGVGSKSVVQRDQTSGSTVDQTKLSRVAETSSQSTLS